MDPNERTTRAVKALYYPYIHFRSIDWLKHALLYWEGVKRIVPSDDYVTNDAPEVQTLIHESLVENVPATKYREEAAKTFRPRLDTLARNRGGNYLAGTDGHHAATALDRETKVHIDKLDENLGRQLIGSGLARQVGTAFRMEEGIAALYMLSLAGEASRKLDAPVVTDSPESEVSSLYFNTYEGTGEVTADGLAMARIICPFPAPASLNNVPLERILEIRGQFSAQRREFRRKMQGLAADLGSVDSPEALNDLLTDSKKEVQDNLSEHRKAIDELKVNTVWTAMSISVPTMIVAAAAAAPIPPVSVAILGATALSIGVINWYSQVRGKQRALSQASPWHYLISLEKEVMDRHSTNFNNGMRQLIFD